MSAGLRLGQEDLVLTRINLIPLKIDGLRQPTPQGHLFPLWGCGELVVI